MRTPDHSCAAATELTAAMDAGEVSVVELALAAIERIERYDAPINAISVRDFDPALAAAREADARRARGETRPLLGVPITIRDSFNVAGLATTWGTAVQGLHPHRGGRRGHSAPPAPPLAYDRDLTVVGPMARSAGDLSLMLDLLVEPDETGIGIAHRLDFRPARHQTPADHRILVVDTHPLIPTSAEIRSVIEDRTPLRFAELLERMFGGVTPPPPF